MFEYVAGCKLHATDYYCTRLAGSKMPPVMRGIAPQFRPSRPSVAVSKERRHPHEADRLSFGCASLVCLQPEGATWKPASGLATTMVVRQPRSRDLEDRVRREALEAKAQAIAVGHGRLRCCCCCCCCSCRFSCCCPRRPYPPPQALAVGSLYGKLDEAVPAPPQHSLLFFLDKGKSCLVGRDQPPS